MVKLIFILKMFRIKIETQFQNPDRGSGRSGRSAFVRVRAQACTPQSKKS
jgi:hypothetical protein